MFSSNCFTCSLYIFFFLFLGGEHDIRFASCACEPLVVTMIRARIWPSSPQRPHLAYTFNLLDWAEALLLECQVSVEDFCKALQFKCRYYKITLIFGRPFPTQSKLLTILSNRVV